MSHSDDDSVIATNDNLPADFFRSLLDFRDYAVFMLNPQGIVLSWNPGAEYIFGYEYGEIVGKAFSTFFAPANTENNRAAVYLQKALADSRCEIEETVWRRNGEPFFANIIITSLKSQAGCPTGFAFVARDISIQKKLEEENRLLNNQLEEKVRQRTEELSTVNKELEAFSYSVSHDLRTPLRAVSGYSMILKEDYEDKIDAEGKRIINVILDNTKKMGALIDDLLTFSRMSRLEVIGEAVNMKRLAEGSVSELLRLEEKKQYAIHIADLPFCKGDPNMLRQVWFNLIGNAIKYSSKADNPAIEVGGHETTQEIVYFVKDNGVGFDMKYYGKLFGVFQRLHREDEFEGTGLGLALVKRIISKHLGRVWGEAEPGMGAVFYFSLPK